MILKKMPVGVTHFNVVVVFCINHKGELIILEKLISHKLYPGLYGFPAGKATPDESIRAAAMRESQEKTGDKQIEQKHIEDTGIILPTLHHERMGEQKPLYFYAHVFLCKRRINIISIDSSEHKWGRFVGPSDLCKFKFLPDALETFEMLIDKKILKIKNGSVIMD